MHAVEARFVVMFVFAATCLPGCAGNPAPQAWRPRPLVAQRSSHGGWISIETAETSGPQSTGRPLAGELIAIDETAVHVLTITGLQSVPRASVHRITVVGYGNLGGALTAWSIAGGISTLSHGKFLLFTAPVWAIAGIVATRTEKRAGLWHDDDLARHFARFPQGLPVDFDPKTLGTLPKAAG